MDSLIKETKELLGDERDEEATEKICTVINIFLQSISMTCVRGKMLQYQRMGCHFPVSIKIN